MSVWVMPFVDVYENFLKRSQAVAGGRRRSQAVGTPNTTQHNTTQHNTTQHNTTQHNTTQHNTTQHKTTHHTTHHLLDVLTRPQYRR